MKTIILPNPDFIGTIPELVSRNLRAQNPGLSYRELKALTRASLGRHFINKEVCVLRAPGNRKRMIALDTPLPTVAQAHIEGPAIIRWVGDNGTIILEPVATQQAHSKSQ